MTKPFENTYEVFTNDAKYKAKDYSLIPEFRISEHMDYYVNEQAGNFLADNDNLFTIHGATYASSSDDNFAKIYLNSDFLKDFGKIREEHKDLASPTKIELKAHAIMKFVPYEGFYPVERTTDLVTLFSQSYGPNMILTGTQPSPRPINQALFAPGILYNSIKSGIGVAHPYITASTGIDNPANGDLNYRDMSYLVYTHLYGKGGLMPFEALLSPESYITSPLLDLVPHPSGILDATASLGSNNILYSLGMHNFLSAVPDFFIKNSIMTSLVSEHDKNNNFYEMELDKEYSMRLYLRGCKYYDVYNVFYSAAQEANEFAQSLNINLDEENLMTRAILGMGLSGSKYFTNPTFTMVSRPNFDHDTLPDPIWGTGLASAFPQSYNHNGSIFGPGYRSSTITIHSSTIGGATSERFDAYGEIKYDGFTPPYFEGFSYIDFIFKPFDESGNIFIGDTLSNKKSRYTIEQIFSNLSSSYYRYGTDSVVDYFGNIQTTVANITGSNTRVVSVPMDPTNMHIVDCINPKSTIKNKKVIYDNDGNLISVEDDETLGTRWVLQTKWESPIFDYSEADVNPQPASGSQNILKGVWTNYGSDLIGEEGLFIQIIDLPEKYINVDQGMDTWQIKVKDKLRTGSLADVVGFSKIPKRVGDIATKQKVYEAIVAIPFLDMHGRRRFFKLEEEYVTLAKTGERFNVNGRDVFAGNSVKKTVEAMKKYVIPPKFDFITYDGKDGKPKVDPIVMYFLEFDYEFDREDIKRIWHNMAPKEKMREATATISHELLENELMDSHSDKLKWMVFKVKQKGAWNYYEKTLDSSDDQRFKFKFNVNDQAAVPDYSYNWPYDFMSVIEFAKLESKVWVETNEEADRRRAKIKPQKAIKPRIDVATSARDLINRTSNFKPAETVPFTIQSNIEQSLLNNIARLTDPNRRETQKENIIANIGTRTKIDANDVGKIIIPSTATQQSSIDEDKIESPINTNTTLFGPRKL